jgi:hypothetical protein
MVVGLHGITIWGAEKAGNNLNGYLQGGTGRWERDFGKYKGQYLCVTSGSRGHKRRKIEPACSSAFSQEVLDLINKCKKIPKLHAKHLY